MNCKPGDLAYIVRDPYPENLGRVVKVVGAPQWIDDGPAWFCQATGGPLRVMNIDRPRETLRDTEFDCYDSDLRPISGVPVEDEVSDEVTA
ncbi:hypothetical protein [Cupriavidus basilensis]|uniref:Uncharacterized protein n=1 Tax=Cupriavidus basilensis TaxID=68895 RepID=A0A0C4YE44_9BURK|nr:hypothetical protein [Cupriavidus basilensis]AJG19051.1 hypothetical protein RR42_m1654 [Cupriavidus basilensis]